MEIARSSRAAACLLCAAMLAAGCGSWGTAEAFGDTPPSEAVPHAADAAAEGIPIDEAHFPDPVFRAVVRDIAKGDVLSQDTIDAQRVLDIPGSVDAGFAIADLTGIECFTALEELDCSYHRLEKLDLSGNPALETLNCRSNRLASLNVSGNAKLKELKCGGNRLASIDLRNTSLTGYDFQEEQVIDIAATGAPIDLKTIDPNIDPNKIVVIEDWMDGATLKGTVLDGYRAGAHPTYLYKTGIVTDGPDGPLDAPMFVTLNITGAAEPPAAADGLTATDADGRPVGADEIEFAEDGALVVKGSGSYVIAMNEGMEASAGRIVIAEGASPTIALDSLVLRPAQGSAIDILPGAGEVNLIVRGSVVLEPQGNDPSDAGAGIQKGNGDEPLTVVGEGPGKGVLTATGTDLYPGIGTGQIATDPSLVCKNIALENLEVTAVGGSRAAGIGGGLAVAEVGGITIEGCDVRAEGGAYAAGIGGGWIHEGGSVYDIVVKDSAVDALSTLDGAGIGSGKAGAGSNTVSNVQILGSTVTAAGGSASAGIGSGWAGTGPNTVSGIRIDGSDVIATGGYGGAGIGAGSSEQGAATASNVSITGSAVTATGGTCGAGIGSGWAWADNHVENVSIAGSTVTATGNAGCPGIGSGYSNDGESALVHVVIADSEVTAQGGGSDMQAPSEETAYAAEDERPDFVIGAGAGIGSGLSNKGDSTASGIAISGSSNVRATAGDDSHAGGGAPGIGSGPAWRGASKAEGIVLQGGRIVAQGGATTASGLGPQTLPAVGAGSGEARASDGAICPADGLAASAWKGASAESAVRFLSDSMSMTSLAEVEDAYLRAEFAIRPSIESTPTGEDKGSSAIGGQSLAATGDHLPPLTAFAGIAASAALAALAARRRRRS